MTEQTPRTMPPPAPGADRAQWDAPPVPVELRAAPHDGLLFLAALTDNRRLLAAWLQVERARARADAVGGAWNG